MLGAFELKKDTNMDSSIPRQVTLQHIAASYLNPDAGLLTIMTDLNTIWHFCWFTKEKRLMRYGSTSSEARFLIKHMLDEPDSVSTPAGFLSRASWNDLFLTTIEESLRPNASDDSHSDGNKGDEEEESINGSDGAGIPDAPLSQRVESLSLSTKKETTRAKKRRANLSQDESSLEFLDKEEELEAVLVTAMETSFHRMLGLPQHQSRKFPPSRIECTQ